jgi:N-acetylglucosamine-6-phosphate deacetylase
MIVHFIHLLKYCHDHHESESTVDGLAAVTESVVHIYRPMKEYTESSPGLVLYCLVEAYQVY